MLYIKEFNLDDLEKEYLFIRNMPIDENGLGNKWHGMEREDFEKTCPRLMSRKHFIFCGRTGKL